MLYALRCAHAVIVPGNPIARSKNIKPLVKTLGKSRKLFTKP